jgi:hypothetical protein
MFGFDIAMMSDVCFFGMLDRLLDGMCPKMKKTSSLQLQLQRKYRFSEPDSRDNVAFDKGNGNHFLIQYTRQMHSF